MRQAHDLAGGHAADHGVALIATGLQCRQHRLDVVFHEQHAGDDDVALGDVLPTAQQGTIRAAATAVGAVVGRGVAALAARSLASSHSAAACRDRLIPGISFLSRARTLDGAGQVAVQRDDDDVDGVSCQRPKWALASYSVSIVIVATPCSRA
jgi:hypothetical protein